MTREDIIRLTKEAGWVKPNHVCNPWSVSVDELERFAALVAAEKEQQLIRDGYRKSASGQRTTQFCGLLDAAVKAEREACAMVAEGRTAAWTEYDYNSACMDCAKAIRARGER